MTISSPTLLSVANGDDFRGRSLSKVSSSQLLIFKLLTGMMLVGKKAGHWHHFEMALALWTLGDGGPMASGRGVG